MIDDGTGSELGDRQEARARQKIIALIGTPSRDKGRERQPGETVPRKETLSRKIAITVEVRLCQTVHFRQQVNL